MKRTVVVRPLEPWDIPLGTTMFVDDVKHFWTGCQWVSEEYLRKIMEPEVPYAIYDKHNKRRAAVAATKHKRNQP